MEIENSEIKSVGDSLENAGYQFDSAAARMALLSLISHKLKFGDKLELDKQELEGAFEIIFDIGEALSQGLEYFAEASQMVLKWEEAIKSSNPPAR